MAATRPAKCGPSSSELVDAEPEVAEYAELTDIWAKVQNGPGALRLAVYRLMGPDLER